MSFFQDLRKLYGKAKLIFRARFRSGTDVTKQLVEAGHGVDLNNTDQVVVALAEESFKEIYPSPKSRILCNDISIPTALASATANLSYAASILLATYFGGMAFYGLGHVFAGDMALMAYLSNFVTNLAVASSAYGVGSFLRKVDRDLTMHLCLDGAKELKDECSKIYYDKVLQIEMAQLNDQKTDEIQAHLSQRSIWQREADTFHYVIEDLKKLRNANGGSVDTTTGASIESLTQRRDVLLEKCYQIDRQVEELGSEAKKIAHNLDVKHVLARILPAAATIDGLKTGALDVEIKRLGENARDRLALISENTKSRRDELLIQIGLDDEVLALEPGDPTPLQIEASKKKDEDEPIVIIE